MIAADAHGSLPARRAIEALRAGVPNRLAALALGLGVPDLVDAFNRRLAEIPAGIHHGLPTKGILVAGEFGGGKSHALECLAADALDRNVAVSYVVISKETPLFDPLKVFRAAVEALRVPGYAGDAFADVVSTRLVPKSDELWELTEWLIISPVNDRFAATMWLFEHGGGDPELQDRLVAFWSGGTIGIPQLRADLRGLGHSGDFDFVKAPPRVLARERLSFVARLLRAAGFAGWVILIDELELIGRYTPLQRGRAYAELARLLGLAAGDAVSGILSIGGITPDFPSAVIRGKEDLLEIGPRFRARGDPESLETAPLAEAAMLEIDQHLHRLPEPSRDMLRSVHHRLAGLYEEAYGLQIRRDSGFSGTAGAQMREYVRAWITEWDLARMYPDFHPDTEVERIRTNYEDDEALGGGSDT